MSRASLKSLPESPSKHHKILTEDSLSNRRRINEADEVFETSEHYKDNNYSILKSFQIMQREEDGNGDGDELMLSDAGD